MPIPIELSAMGKLSDTDVPVMVKMVLGPSAYSQTTKFEVTFDDLPRVELIGMVGPVRGADGSLVFASYAEKVGDNKWKITLSTIAANTTTGAISAIELADGYTGLATVPLIFIVIGDTTKVKYPQGL